MRILTIGLPLPNREIDNHNLANAPSFFDYDAIVVNPLAISQMIDEVVRGEGDYRTPSDEPVYDGPSVAGAAGLWDLIRHRRGEVQRHLDAGGLVVSLAVPNAHHPAVARFPGCDRYSWLPNAADVDWTKEALLPGYGTEFVITDFDHPFAAYLDKFRERVAYRAYLSDQVRGHVFARSVGGAPIAADMPISAGRLIWLPTLREVSGGGDRMEIADWMVECCRRAMGDRLDVGAPEWVDQFSVPGLEAELAALRDAEIVRDAAQAQVEEFAIKVERLAKFRRLLWQIGPRDLQPIVRESLALLGFSIVSAESEPLVIADGGERVFVEVEGSARPVDMSPHYRLRRRWEAELAKTGESRRGLIVINGLRDLRPEYRIQQYDDALRVAAESMHYCIVTTADLFEMVCAVLGGGSDEAVAAFRRAIVETDGVLKLPLPTPPAASGPAPEADGPTSSVPASEQSNGG